MARSATLLRAGAGVLVIGLLIAAHERAGGAAPGRTRGALPAQPEAGFWSELVDPKLELYQQLLSRGKLQLEMTLGSRLGKRVRHLVRDAVQTFELATQVHGDRWEGHYWHAVALYHADRPAEAVDAFDRARDRGQRASGRSRAEFEGVAEDIAFKLGVALSKLGRFERAVKEYERGLRYAVEDHSRAIIESNCAESLMAIGRLGEAVRRYRRATELDAKNSLTYWGLGVALDRDDQPARAREAIQRALQLDPQMRELGDDNVFFVPPGDAHYYFAFGLEVAGRYDEAEQRWQKFLDALPRSPWARRARAHLEELKRLPRPRPGPRPLRLELLHLEGGTALGPARKYVERRRAEIGRCFRRVPAHAAPKVRLRLSIGDRGQVSSVGVSPTGDLWGIGDCAKKIAGRWKLPGAQNTIVWVNVEAGPASARGRR